MSEILRLVGFAEKHSNAPLALATVVRTQGSTYRRPGARMLVSPNGESSGGVSGGCLERDVTEHARAVIANGTPRLLRYDTRLTLGCNGVVEIFVERVPGPGGDVLGYLRRQMEMRKPALLTAVFAGDLPLGSYPHFAPCFPREWEEEKARTLRTRRSALRTLETPLSEAFFGWIEPPIRLVVLGTGSDVAPLVRLANVLGWQAQIIGHPGAAGADMALLDTEEIIVSEPQELAARLQPDAFTAVVLMTHHFGRDCAFLRSLLPLGLPYLGLLGPAKRREQLLAALAEVGAVPEPEMLATLRSPVGLDLGGETPEEIALSIVAEVRAVLGSRTGAPLRNRKAHIHDDAARSSTAEKLTSDTECFPATAPA